MGIIVGTAAQCHPGEVGHFAGPEVSSIWADQIFGQIKAWRIEARDLRRVFRLECVAANTPFKRCPYGHQRNRLQGRTSDC